MFQCSIKFENNPLNIYTSGSNIKGQVEITFDEPTEIDDIFLKIAGKVAVRWYNVIEDDIDVETINKINYTASEDLIDSKISLKYSNTCTIDPRKHIYNFLYKLPSHLPTSFESKLGYIRYVAKVILVTTEKIKYAYSTGFTVIDIIDLNQDPSLKLKSIVEIEKYFIFWPCINKSLAILVTLPQTGYVCGEKIRSIIQIYNQSNQKIDNLKIYLMKIVKYISHKPTINYKIEERSIIKTYITSIKNTVKEVFNVELKIPPTPPSTLNSISKYIEIKYELRVKGTINGSYSGPVVVTPIVIGSIPLNKKENFTKATYEILNEMLTANNKKVLPEIPAAEATMKRVILEKDDDNNKTEFLPTYPIYNFD